MRSIAGRRSEPRIRPRSRRAVRSRRRRGGLESRHLPWLDWRFGSQEVGCHEEQHDGDRHEERVLRHAARDVAADDRARDRRWREPREEPPVDFPARTWAIAAVSAATPEIRCSRRRPRRARRGEQHDRQADVPEHEPDAAARDGDEEAPERDERERHERARAKVRPLRRSHSMRPSASRRNSARRQARRGSRCGPLVERRGRRRAVGWRRRRVLVGEAALVRRDDQELAVDSPQFGVGERRGVCPEVLVDSDLDRPALDLAPTDRGERGTSRGDRDFAAALVIRQDRERKSCAGANMNAAICPLVPPPCR